MVNRLLDCEQIDVNVRSEVSGMLMRHIASVTSSSLVFFLLLSFQLKFY